MQTAGGFDFIVFLVIGAVVVINWVVQQRRERKAGGEGGAPAAPEDAGDEWQPLERLPRPGEPPALPDFQPRHEASPPHREPSIAVPGTPHARAVRPPPSMEVPPVFARRGTVAPRTLEAEMAGEEEALAAPLRPAGEAPGMLEKHGDEWMSQEMPTLRRLEVPAMPAPNTVPDAPPPPYVPVPAAVAPASRRGVRAPAATPASGRNRPAYRLTLNPRTMRQAIVLSEVLGRPRGYDL